MDIVLLIHSLVRFALLVGAIVGIIKTAVNLAQKSEPAPLDRAISSAFVGVYDLQVLLGILIVFLGGLTNALHPIVMFVGVVIAHVLQSMSRRAQGANAHQIRLAFYIFPLVTILLGLAIIGHLPV